MKLYREILKCGIYYHSRRWVLILFLCCYFFLPEKTPAFEQDSYRFNTIRLGIDFSYLNDTYENNAYTSEKTESFEQRYNLDVKGLVIDPNLMVYNASIGYVDTATETTSLNTHSKVDNYAFDTTILRKSRIPLSLAASRSTTDTTSGVETTTDNFGAGWYLKLRTLPWTKLSYDKTQTNSTETDEDTETSSIEMSKKIGPTDNSIGYTTSTSTNSFSNYDAQINVFTIRNDTTLPGAKFYLGMAKSDYLTSQDNANSDIETTAGSLGVKTTPLAGLDQEYSYTFTSTKSVIDSGTDDTATDSGSGETNSGFFYGKMGYKPTKKLNLYMNAQSGQNESLSETSDTISKTTKFSTGATYFITKELSTTESINYTQEESTTGDPLTGNTERTTTETGAALNYAKKLSWSDLSAAVSLGHHKETVNPDAGGEGVSYGFNTGLTGINMKYFTLSSNYGYSTVESYSDNVDMEDQVFSSNAVSSYIRTIPLSVSYSYHSLDSYLDGEDGVDSTVSASASAIFLKWLPITASFRRYTLVRPDVPPGVQMTQIRDKEEDTVSLSSNLLYFDNTTFSASSEYTNSTQTLINEETGTAEDSSYISRNIGINGSHSRVLYRGKLNISTSYKESIKEDKIINTTDYYSNLIIKGTYDKKMSRNVMLSLKAERSFDETNGLYDTATALGTDVLYRLRQWLLSAEYLHSIKEKETSGGLIEQENRVMVKLSRSFVKTF